MKTIKLITIWFIISIHFLCNLRLTGQEGAIAFMETYRQQEILARLEPVDPLYQMLKINRDNPGTAMLGTTAVSNVDGVWDYIHSKAFLEKLPGNITFAWGINSDEGQQKLFALKEPGQGSPGPGQNDILGVSAQRDDRNDSWNILIDFSREGAEKWASLTGNNVGREIAIVIDGMVYAAPKVNMKIEQGKCLISGNFTEDEAEGLVALLGPPL
jgi:SecD/SecF fusion protein